MPEELLQGISTYQILYYVDTAFVFPYCVKLRYTNSQIDEKDRETPRKGKRMACCVRCGGVPQYHIQLMEVRTYQNPLIYEQEPVQIMERTVEGMSAGTARGANCGATCTFCPQRSCSN